MGVTVINFVLGLFIAAFAVYCIILMRRNDKLRDLVDQKTRAIDNLFKQMSVLGQDKLSYHDRVVQLENAIENSFGVTVRQEITEVRTDFTKFEWVILLAGVHKLLSGSKDPEDTRIYLAVIDKVQAFIDDLKEETGE